MEETGEMELNAPVPGGAGQDGVETSEEATASTETDGGQPAEAASTAAAEEIKKPPRGVQKRLDELTREKYESKREAEHWRQEAEHWRQMALAGREAGTRPLDQAQNVPETPKMPKPEDFDDYDKYVEARIAYEVSQKVKEALERAEAERARLEQEAREREEQQRVQAIVEESTRRARQRYADFDDVVSSLDVAWSKEAISALREMPDGAAILYYLGKNPQEANRISKLSPIGQIREIGKLEARISSVRPPEPKRITNTGEPPRTVSGIGVAERSLDEMSMEDYARYRMKQMAAQGG